MLDELPGIVGQQRQQLELFSRESDFLPAAAYAAAGVVEGQSVGPHGAPQ
jgi:hypothetical protein